MQLRHELKVAKAAGTLFKVTAASLTVLKVAGSAGPMSKRGAVFELGIYNKAQVNVLLFRGSKRYARARMKVLQGGERKATYQLNLKHLQTVLEILKLAQSIQNAQPSAVTSEASNSAEVGKKAEHEA